MKRLGIVENISYDGSVLVRATFPPIRGMRVLDGRRHAVGTVTRVFGPVREPFASVRPAGKVPLSILGSAVYVQEGNDASSKSRRSGRSH